MNYHPIISKNCNIKCRISENLEACLDTYSDYTVKFISPNGEINCSKNELTEYFNKNINLTRIEYFMTPTVNHEIKTILVKMIPIPETA